MPLTRPTIQNLNTNLTAFSDSILIANFGNVANRDIGMIYDRSQGSASNVALVWKESTSAFGFFLTNSTGKDTGNITVTGNANVALGNLILNGSGIFWSNGTQFTSGGGGGTGITYTANTAPPSSGNISGDQWYNTATDVLYEYQNDGTNSYWVDVTGPIFSGAAAQTGNVAVSGYLIPTANLTYDLGTAGLRWRSLYLSGNTIDLSGASITTDSTSGAIALIPQPTATTPNPTALIISATGGLTTASTTAGNLNANTFANSAASATPAVSTGKAVVMSMIFGG